MKRLMIPFALIFAFYGCAKRATVPPPEGVEEVSILEEEELVEEVPVEEETTAVVEEPPPVEEEVTLPPVEEEVTLPPPEEKPPVVEEEVAVTPPVTEEAPPPPPPPTTEAPRQVLGFRVQIFASSTEKGAQKVAQDAKSAFTEAVYVDYEVPYYKVRIGDCLTRGEARELRKRAIQLGYRGAFIVETEINLR